MSRSFDSADTGHSPPTRSFKCVVAEGHALDSGTRFAPFTTQPTSATASAAAGTRAPARLDGSFAASATDVPHERVSRQLTGAGPPARTVSVPVVPRREVAVSDTNESSPASPVEWPAQHLSAHHRRRGVSRGRSVSSDAPASSEYYSLGSPAVPTTSLEDVPMALAASSTVRQRQRSPSGVEWQAGASTSSMTGPASAPALPPLQSNARQSNNMDAAAMSLSSRLGSGPRSWTVEERRDPVEQSRRGGSRAASRPALAPGPPASSTTTNNNNNNNSSGGGGEGRAVDGGDGVAQRGGGIGAHAASAGAAASQAYVTGQTNSGGGGAGGEASNMTRDARHLFCQPFKDAEAVCTARTTSASDWVVLNVGGRLITTTVSTLMADPDSVLASLCACLVRPSPSMPSMQARYSGEDAGEYAHRDPAASNMLSADITAAAAGACAPGGSGAQRRGADAERNPCSGGGDTHSLTVDDGSDEDGGFHAAAAASSSSTTAHLAVDVAGARASRTGPTEGDGDHSNPSPDRHAQRPPRRSSGSRPLLLQQQQQEPQPPPPLSPPRPTAFGEGRHPSPSSMAVGNSPARGLRESVLHDAEEGDGEVVNPRQPPPAVALDTDRYNAVLLDLDADYFLPVLNYLRHGAVMIPQHLNVDGVLAMAEYLNVTGLVRQLRGPPVPRRVLLFSWGSGGNGELGTHAMRDEPTPTMAQVTPFGVRVREIALGANYSCALTDKGHIYTFGNGEWGQLGLGSTITGGRAGALGAGSSGNNNNNNNNGNGNNGNGGAGQDGSAAEVPVELLIPRRIPLFEQLPAVHVAAGYAFAMAIVEDHHVYFWGNNNHGQSGRGRSFFDPHTKKVDTPVLVETLEGKRIIQLSCGSFFALALSEDGALYSWGLVDCVGLGTPEEVERRYHAVLGESLSNERRSVVLTPQLVTVKGRRRANTNTAAASAAAGSPIANAASEKIVRLRAGQWHSGAINEHGELFTWGVGYQGRLGHGSKTPAYVPTLVQGALEGQHVVDVACGSFHTVALTSRGAVFCWGDNASGQCGTTANSPDAFTAPYRVVGLEYVAGGVARSIACGRQHTVVVMAGPQPWCGWPCCQVDAGGRAAHSHGQVYCFGEVARAGGVGGVSSGVAAGTTGGNGGPVRGSAGGPHGVPLAGLNGSALPGTPNHAPFTTGGGGPVGGAYMSSPHGQMMGLYGARPTLAGTAGHHHPHYQLVTGLQHVDVRAVVSGLHHTFAYVEELMSGGGVDGDASNHSIAAAGEVRGVVSGGHAHGYQPYYANDWSRPPPPMSPYGLSSSRVSGGGCGGGCGAVVGGAYGAASPFYLRGLSAGPTQFNPPDWGFGMVGGSNLPPPANPLPRPPTSPAAGVSSNSTRRIFFSS